MAKRKIYGEVVCTAESRFQRILCDPVSGVWDHKLFNVKIPKIAQIPNLWAKKKLYNIERRTFSTSFSESDLGTCDFRLLGLGYFVLSQQKSKAISKSPRYWQVFAVQLLITSSAPWLIPILFKFYIMAFYKTIKKPIRRELFMKSAL